MWYNSFCLLSVEELQKKVQYQRNLQYYRHYNILHMCDSAGNSGVKSNVVQAVGQSTAAAWKLGFGKVSCFFLYPVRLISPPVCYFCGLFSTSLRIIFVCSLHHFFVTFLMVTNSSTASCYVCHFSSRRFFRLRLEHTDRW
jgi:hypothetical protein